MLPAFLHGKPPGFPTLSPFKSAIFLYTKRPNTRIGLFVVDPEEKTWNHFIEVVTDWEGLLRKIY